MCFCYNNNNNNDNNNRGGKRHNLASVIKKRTTETRIADHNTVSHKTKFTDAATLLANAVSDKIEDGNIRAAIRIMCSEDKPAQNTDSVYAQLVGKHPAPPLDRGSAPDPQPTVALVMTEEEVIRAVLSFPPGSAGGLDGVRPQHMPEMVGCRESGSELRSALTGFVNYLMQGHIHPQVSRVLFGGNLIVLEKKSGGRLHFASYCRQMCQQLRHRDARFLQRLQQPAQRSDAMFSAFNSPGHLPILPSLLQ